MKKVNFDGLTGMVKLDNKGVRADIKLYVSELGLDGLEEIGTWSPSAGLNITEDEEDDDDEEDEVLRVLSVPVSPFMMVKEVDGKSVYSGFCVDLLDKLSQELDFKYELHVMMDGARGIQNDTGHWNGMIGEVIAGKADLALADLTITEMRERVIDFTLPYMTAGLVAVTKKGQPRSPGGIWAFFLPLTREVWIYILLATACTIFVMYISARLSFREWMLVDDGKGGECMENRFNLFNCFLFVLTTLLHQRVSLDPRAPATRVLAGFWYFFTFIVLAIVVSNLCESILWQDSGPDYDSVDQLMKTPGFTYIAIRGGSTRSYLEYVERSGRNNPGTFAEGLDRVKNEDKVAFIMEYATAAYVTQSDCEFSMTDTFVHHSAYGIVTARAALYAFLAPWMIYLTSRLQLATLKRVSLSIRSDGPHYAMNTPECLVPLYEPFHWSAVYSYRRTLSIENKCRGIEQFVFFVNVSVPQLNAKRLQDSHGLTPSSLECHYRVVVGSSSGVGAGDDVETGPRRPLVFGERLLEEHVNITCLRDGVPLFTEFHQLPVQKKQPNAAPRRRRSEWLNPWVRFRDKLSVLVVGIGSVSRLNSMRHLRKTRRYLSSKLNAYEFLGFTAVTNDPLESQISLLAGLDLREMWSLPQERDFHVPLHLVSAYSGRGYATLFAVDSTKDDSPFVDDRRGYGNPPVDYSTRTFVQATEKLEQNASCQSLTSRSEALLRYVRAVFQLDTAPVPKFGYVWLSQHGRGGVNAVGYLDQPLKFFLRNLSESGVLNRTALLLLSNYGKRAGSMTLTSSISEHEVKAPFGFLVLPQTFLRKNPDIAVALEVNQRRLVSAYDIHATLLALARRPDDKYSVTERGLSLLRPLPPKRSCGDVFAQPGACACLGSRSTELPYAADLSLFARFAVDHMNNVTESNFPGLCIRWELYRVKKADVIGGGDDVGMLEIRFELTTRQDVTFEVYGAITEMSSEYRSLLSKGILKLQEDGRLQWLQERWWKPNQYCGQGDDVDGDGDGDSDEEDEEAHSLEARVQIRQLNGADLAGAFVIVYVGFIIAGILAVGELFYVFSTRAKRETHLNSIAVSDHMKQAGYVWRKSMDLTEMRM
ncbi:hypothetical protein MTO96_010931 [Rhipicephalus appendiculatus]